MKSNSTPLLELLQTRWETEVKHIVKHKLPIYARSDVHDAAKLHAQANDSDPFAYARAAHYLRRGLALPSEVASDARARLAAR